MDKNQQLNLCANAEVVVGLGSITIGLLLILAPGTALFDGYNATIAQAFWGEDSLSDSAMKMNHWLLATCGAGVMGWGMAWTAIAHIPFRKGEKWAWFCLMLSLLVWGLLDLAIALWFGVTGEVIFVLAATTFGVLPLVYSTSIFWRHTS